MKYWLVKSEPDEFSISSLQKAGVEPWTGVRNFQARNYMRDHMSVGDLVLFAHSNTTPPGVAGTAEVASKPYPDPTQFDPTSEYYDPRATPEKPIWMLVDLRYHSHLPRLVTLQELREDPIASAMVVCKRGNRLSVTPVQPAEYTRVLELSAN